MPTHEIDDTDSSIEYLGIWTTEGAKEEFQSTTHLTSQAGAQLLVTFEGTSIAVYGTITWYGAGAVSRYSVDDASPSTYTSPVVIKTEYKTLFFQSPTLSNGQHSLLVTSLVGAFYVDSFVISTEDEVKLDSATSSSQPNPPNSTQRATHTIEEKTIVSTLSPTPSSPLTSSSPNASAGSDAESTSGSKPSSTSGNRGVDKNSTPGAIPQSSPQTTTTLMLNPPPLDSQPSPNRLPIGIIAGVATAGVLVVAFIVFFLWRYRRRSAKYAKSSIQRRVFSRAHTNTTGVTPFVLSEALNGSSGQAGSPSSSTYDLFEKQPLHGSETSPFLDPSSSADRRDVHDIHSTSSSSALSGGHVRKSSRRGASTPARAPIPANPSMWEGTQSQISTAQSDGSILEYHQDMMDNLPPPAYHEPTGRNYS